MRKVPWLRWWRDTASHQVSVIRSSFHLPDGRDDTWSALSCVDGQVSWSLTRDVWSQSPWRCSLWKCSWVICWPTGIISPPLLLHCRCREIQEPTRNIFVQKHTFVNPERHGLSVVVNRMHYPWESLQTSGVFPYTGQMGYTHIHYCQSHSSNCSHRNTDFLRNSVKRKHAIDEKNWINSSSPCLGSRSHDFQSLLDEMRSLCHLVFCDLHRLSPSTMMKKRSEGSFVAVQRCPVHCSSCPPVWPLEQPSPPMAKKKQIQWLSVACTSPWTHDDCKEHILQVEGDLHSTRQNLY